MKKRNHREKDMSESQSQSFSKSSNSNDLYYDPTQRPDNDNDEKFSRAGSEKAHKTSKLKIEKDDQRFMSSEDLRMDSIVQSAVLQPNRRRKGIKRIGTGLKILIDDDSENIEGEDLKPYRKDGIFMIKEKEVIYDIKSLFLFPASWRIRKWIVFLIVSPYFDYFILSCIFANSINLALYDYSQESSLQNDLSYNDVLEIIFTLIFLVEAVLKVIGMGLISHRNSYLRESWNILDFIVVLVSLVEFVPNVPSLKSLRVLRVLRPLRSINAIPSMRMLVSTLFISIPQLGPVLVFLSFVFLLFGIMGINQYTGEIYSQ